MYLEKEIGDYLNWKAGYTKKAAVNYALHLRRFADYTKKDLCDIDLVDVINFQLYMKKRYALANVAYSMIIIKNFFTFYRKQGTACLDPYFIKIPKFIPHSHFAITEEEHSKILSVFRDDEFFNIQKKVIFSLLHDTGIRVSELCDLNVSDLTSANARAIIVTKKNNKQRWIFWTQETHNLLLGYLGTRICLNQDPALFFASSNNRRRRITTRTVQRWMKEACLLSEITRKLSPHGYRHGKAHTILDKNGTVKDIQFILGHSDTNPISAFSYLRLNASESEKRALMFL